MIEIIFELWPTNPGAPKTSNTQIVVIGPIIARLILIGQAIKNISYKSNMVDLFYNNI